MSNFYKIIRYCWAIVEHLCGWLLPLASGSVFIILLLVLFACYSRLFSVVRGGPLLWLNQQQRYPVRDSRVTGCLDQRIYRQIEHKIRINEWRNIANADASIQSLKCSLYGEKNMNNIVLSLSQSLHLSQSGHLWETVEGYVKQCSALPFC